MGKDQRTNVDSDEEDSDEEVFFDMVHHRPFWVRQSSAQVVRDRTVAGGITGNSPPLVDLVS
jgi:hypothetical protein